MKIFNAPVAIKNNNAHMNVFLSGPIIDNWHDVIEKELSGYSDELLSVFNPVNNKYPPLEKQTINNKSFYKQVRWELDNLNLADIIFVYFHPDSAAPVTMLEFGLFANDSNIILVCPDGFYRKGEIEIVAEVHNIELNSTLKDGILNLHKHIKYEKNRIF